MILYRAVAFALPGGRPDQALPDSGEAVIGGDADDQSPAIGEGGGGDTQGLHCGPQGERLDALDFHQFLSLAAFLPQIQRPRGGADLD